MHRMGGLAAVEASHEPYPLIPSFSTSVGEGARRADEGDSDRFVVPIFAQKGILALHGPTHPYPSQEGNCIKLRRLYSSPPRMGWG